MDVAFLVNRGPATRIEIEGIVMPKDELDAMQEMWSRTVFDRFVVQDAEARVQRHLLASGFVSGAVTGKMEVANGEKTLRLSVTPGPPSSRRAIRFAGNSAIRSKDLEAVVTQSDLEVQGWIDRAALDETLYEPSTQRGVPGRGRAGRRAGSRERFRGAAGDDPGGPARGHPRGALDRASPRHGWRW